MKKISLLKTHIFFIGIFLVAIFLRWGNLQTPFWVDEFSTARNSYLVKQHGLNVFWQNQEFLEHHNISTHFLVALFFQIWGTSEANARIPMVIIGGFVPIIVYLLAKQLYDQETGIYASLLTTFSYFEITWSRQARSYVLQQLLMMSALWVYSLLIKQFSLSKFILLIVILFLGLITHTTFILLILVIILHFIYLCFHWDLFSYPRLKRWLPYLGLTLLPLGVLFFINNYGQGLIGGLAWAWQVKPNNLWYYHSFLWREQTIISLLAGLAIIMNLGYYRKGTFLVLMPLVTFLFFLCFMFPPYVSRYLLPVFPLLLILAGMAIANVSKAIHPKYHLLFGFLILGLIIGNGDKFVIKPKAYYSVNHDMREVALLDYDQVYELIKTKVVDSKNYVAVIDTWPDRARWYLGYDYPHIYYFHWENEVGNVNGLDKTTKTTSINDEKGLPEFNNPPIRFIGDIADLELAMSKYKIGFIWIDDASMPQDVIDYVRRNMKQEIYLDHYPLDDNPYSIWPGTLYSWGFEN